MKTAPLSRRPGFRLSLQIGVPVLLLAAWWASSVVSTNPFFPPLPAVLQQFADLWFSQHFVTDVIPSVGNVVIGFLLAGAIGLVLGVVFALAPPFRALLNPIVQFWRAIPPIALIPIFVSIFGFGNDVRLLVIVLASIFPTMISTMDGLRSVDQTAKDVTAVFGLTFSERLFRVYLPAAGPQIVSGLRVTLQVSIVVMIASEMLGSPYGIGALTLQAQQTFQVKSMWAGIILLGLLGYGANLLFDIGRNRVLRWYDGAKQSRSDF